VIRDPTYPYGYIFLGRKIPTGVSLSWLKDTRMGIDDEKGNI
jgi:hypothetical protein